jgi:transcriptional regulator with XRE-family HTH domain
MPKKRKVIGEMRPIFAGNLRRAMERRLPRARNPASELERLSGVSDSSINRWLNEQSSPNLDQIEAVALALGLRPHELLIPLFGVTRR